MEVTHVIPCSPAAQCSQSEPAGLAFPLYEAVSTAPVTGECEAAAREGAVLLSDLLA